MESREDLLKLLEKSLAKALLEPAYKPKVHTQEEICTIFPWKVIDKSNQTDHPLWFRRYEDLLSFYAGQPSLCVNLEQLRVIEMNPDGSEKSRFQFEA